MRSPSLSRRDLLRGSVALAAYTLASRPLEAFGLEPASGEELIPFLDPQPYDPKRPMLRWANLTQWITANEDLYEVSHYPRPTIDPSTRPPPRADSRRHLLNCSMPHVGRRRAAR